MCLLFVDSPQASEGVVCLLAEELVPGCLLLFGPACRLGPVFLIQHITLQDLVEEARAELYREQARKLRIENDAAEA